MISFSKWLLSELLLLAKIVVFTIVVTAVCRPLETSPLPVVTFHKVASHFTHASWYGPGFFHHYRKDGKRYDKNDIFVAHRTYPIGTVLRVTNLRNRRSINVIVKDRGPYIRGRDLDLSWSAAGLLGMRDEGVALVAYRVVS